MDDKAETRQRILDSARRLFHDRGYTAVGVADLCREAGVVKGSFYHFFASKDELLAETIRRNWSQLEDLLRHLENSDLSGRDCLQKLFSIIVAEARQMHKNDGRILGCRLGSIASEIGPGDAAGSAQARVAFDGWRRSLRRLIRRGQRDGSIVPTISANAAADALLASIQGMSVLGRALHQPSVLKRVADLALQQVPAP